MNLKWKISDWMISDNRHFQECALVIKVTKENKVINWLVAMVNLKRDQNIASVSRCGFIDSESDIFFWLL